MTFNICRAARVGAPALLLVTSFFCAGPTPAAPDARHAAPIRANGDFRSDLDMAREKVYPALVNIAVVSRYFEGGRAQRSPAGGSGAIISPDGYVLTNFHVAGHTTQITCTTANGVSYPATVVGHDPLSDISVLKLQLPKGHAPLTFAKLGDSDKLQVGDFVLAMGNPLMLSSSMTLGIISNTRRVFTDFTGTQIEAQTLETGERTGVFTRWLLHDALILPGNSGGPLVNLSGEVVGINELGGNGVGFAIPANIARYVFEQTLKYGSVRRAWLGVNVMPVAKLGRTAGALVSSVTLGSPADKAGFKPGEIITSVDSRPVDVQFFEQVPLFYQQIATMSSGHAAKVALLDDGKPVTRTAALQWMPPYLGDEDDFPTAGITVRAITPAMAQDAFLPSTDGVMLTGVRGGYAFGTAQPTLAPGDVITALASHPVKDIASFRSTLDAATKASQPGDRTLVAFRRNDEDLLTTVTLVRQPQTNSSEELPQAWLGVKTQVMLPEIAAGLNSPDLKGFRVTEVYPYTQASKAGLKVGDVITKINDTALDASRPQDADDLRQAVQALSIGDSAKLTIVRGGQAQALPVTLEADPSGQTDQKSVTVKELEFSVREINDIDRFENHWTPAQKGLLVTGITSGGYASIAGLEADDLIVSIDGQAINTLNDLRTAMAAAAKKHPRSIEVYVRRAASTSFVFIEPEWSKVTTLTVE